MLSHTPFTHMYICTWTYTQPMLTEVRVQELCESRGGRPALSVLMSLTVSVDVKQHWTMLRHWSQFFPNMSTDIRWHEALHHHHLTEVRLGSHNSQNWQAAAVLRVLSFIVALRPQRPHGLLETGSPGRPPRFSHSSWALWLRVLTISN